ncbi:MAG: hypothetical protein E7585_07465 [Ruminococcaceae bacterium]|nr:hypothetical protein [Oscillospiraceae bacterium]
MNNEAEKSLTALSKERLAYMVAWRDRHIEKMQDRLAGREEVNDMLQTLLFYALARVADRRGNGVREIRIPKAEITAALGQWGCDTTDGGDHYLVTFTEARKPSKHGEAEKK